MIKVIFINQYFYTDIERVTLSVIISISLLIEYLISILLFRQSEWSVIDIVKTRAEKQYICIYNVFFITATAVLYFTCLTWSKINMTKRAI